MATLTGKITDVTGRAPDSISSIAVKAPSARIGGGSDIIVSSPAAVTFNKTTGDITLSGLHVGLSWLYIEGDGWSDSIPLAVAEGFQLILEAVANASGVPGIADYVSMIRNSEAHARLLVRAAIDGEIGEVVRLAQAAATTAAREATTADARATYAETKADNAVSRVESLEALGGLSPESPVDGQTANLITQGDTLTSMAVGEVVRGKVTEAVSVPLTPLFLDPLPFGVQNGGPANVRTGLSPQHGTGGGWVEELSIPVVGDKGTKTLTSTDAATVDGFVTQRWLAAVSTGERDFYVEVVGTDAGGVIHLRDPLPVDVEGYLSARYDTAQGGQHLTRRGTRAYVESLLNISPIFASRGSIITGAWADQPVKLQSLWRKNAAFEEVDLYVVSEGGRVVVGGIGDSPLNHWDPEHLTPFSHGSEAALRAGVEGAGQGLIADFAPAGRAAIFEFNVGCYRPSHPPESFAVNVKVTADGVVILDTLDSGALRNYRIPIAGVSSMTVEVTSASTTEHYLVVSETTLRTANVDAPRHGRGKIVTLGDSWMAWYNGEFAKVLAEKTGAQVVDHSLGGMTTEWGLAWWDEYVTSEKPDEVWLHFFTNDLNALTNNTFVAPDGSTKPMWTVSAGDETRKVWRQNIWEMIRRAQTAGIRPVIIMPSATVATSQTQRHMHASSILETPPLDSSYSATPEEINSIEWVGNRRNKYEGKPLKVGSSTVWATGSQPEDEWTDPNSDILMNLLRLTLNRSDYVTESTGYRHSKLGDVTEDVVSFDDSGDVPSLTVTWGDGGTAGSAHRIAGDVSVVAGREYLTVAQIAEATSSLSSSLTNVSGSYVPLLSDGPDYLLRREVAGTSNAIIQVGAPRGDSSAGSQLKIAATLAIIDVGALIRDAPNLDTKTDVELAQFALSLT